jgi:hypothetical protein
MDKKTILLSLFLLLIILSCNDKSVNLNKLNCDQNIIIDNTLFENAPDDSFHFKNVEIIGNCLKLTIEYGGGCGNVEIKLIDSGLVMESNPGQRNIRVSFKDEDFCKALVIKEISFDLSPIQIIGDNKVSLNLSNWNKSILYQY